MILKELRLKNIRTYEEETVEFPRGIMLFEGGIGSGKSTILLALEFALFGLGDEKGSTLLSLGKNQGEVELIFEVSGKDCRVHRKLVRGRRGASARSGSVQTGTVSQDDCWIECGGSVDRLSPKEMKERVLKVLGFNEPPSPNAKSQIFRYAVYTPQEDMKAILNDKEMRIQTIRKALRLEDYKVASDNASLIASDIKTQAKMLIKRADRIPAIDGEISAIEDGLPGLDSDISETEEEIDDIEVEIRFTKSEWERLRARREELAGEAKKAQDIEAEISRVEGLLKMLMQSIEKNEVKLTKIREQLQQPLPGASEPPSMEYLEDMIKDARKRLSDCRRNAGMYEHELSNYAQLVENGVCPTCKQQTNGEEFTSRLGQAKAKLEENKRAVEDVEGEIAQLEEGLEGARDYEQAVAKRGRLEEMEDDLEERLASDRASLSSNTMLMEDLKGRRDRSGEANLEYAKVRDEFDSNERRRSEAEARKLALIRKIDSLEKDKALSKVRIEGLRKEKDTVLAEKASGEALMEHSDWLNGYFGPALNKIEQSIMTASNRDFDAEFSKWFAYLVEDPTKSVRVDEEFKPLISQDAYEQEVGNLSGGERTALALAYRLALNKVVQKNTDIDANLLILDEPTDGFSKDQIGKMGDLLKELNLQQGIIVSHERELEGAVDHIFRVHKESGRSKISPV